MKTNRAVPNQIWPRIEATLTKKAPIWALPKISVLSGAVALLILAIGFVEYQQRMNDHVAVNAYLYELHSELYPGQSSFQAPPKTFPND